MATCKIVLSPPFAFQLLLLGKPGAKYFLQDLVAFPHPPADGLEKILLGVGQKRNPRAVPGAGRVS